MNFVMVFLSFIFSMTVAIFIMRSKKSRLLAMMSAFAINTILLGSAYWLLYHLNEESRLFGIDFYHRYQLLISIPTTTWIIYFLLSFYKTRAIRA